MPESFSDAVAHFQAGRWTEAVDVAQRLVSRESDHADAWQMMGLALCRMSRFDDGVAALEQAVRLKPTDATLANNVGEGLRQAGRLQDAERVLRKALVQQSRFAEAAFNLGNVLRDMGRSAEAIASFQAAVEFRPNYAKAHLNLANLLRTEGRLPRSAEHYRMVLALQPPRAEVLLTLSGVCSDLGEHADAAELAQHAARLEPESEAVIKTLGNLARSQGNDAVAREQFSRLSAREPRSLLSQLRVATILPAIPSSPDEIEQCKESLLRDIESIRERDIQVDLATLHTFGAEAPMAWAYHGLDMRPLKVAYASLFAEKLKPMEVKPRTGRPHVGVVVTNGHEGVYAECLGRLVARLPSADLDVTVVCSPAGSNILTHLLGETRAKHLVIPDRIDQAAQRLHDANFDLLHYWEVGTDSQNYFLPFLKPARIQSTGWGWPVTSGLPSIDYFLSCDLIESDEADAHYTETLIRLKRLPTWYARPPVAVRERSRSETGLPPDGAIYLCTQNLRKYHPDFDLILGELLRRDSAGHVAVIEDSHPSITRRLRERLAGVIPDVASRVVFLPRRPRTDYLHVVANADVMLDTIHYGGGANSLYDAFACGTPVVSLPGPFHRSRYALGAYRQMGFTDLIASSVEDYVVKVHRIATDIAWRRELHERLLERCDVLFSDDTAVMAHREFFEQTIAGGYTWQ